MRRIIRAACCIPFIAAFCIQAQEPTTPPSANPSDWKIAVNTNLTLTLNTYSNNWTGGEFSALAWAWQFNGTAQRAFTPWLTNVNTLKCQFGQTAQQVKTATGDKHWEPPQKSSDLIDAEALFRITVSSVIEPFVDVRGITQFADSRNPDSLVGLNPFILTESFGGLRQITKTKVVDWTARLGGALRQSIDRNTSIDTSLRPDKKVTTDGGIELVTLLKAVSANNKINYTTELKAYAALFSSMSTSVENTPRADYWKYPDITWEHTLGVNLTKYVMLNFYAKLLYDREIDQDVRYKQTLGLGLSYAFATK